MVEEPSDSTTAAAVAEAIATSVDGAMPPPGAMPGAVERKLSSRSILQPLELGVDGANLLYRWSKRCRFLFVSLSVILLSFLENTNSDNSGNDNDGNPAGEEDNWDPEEMAALF